MVHSVKSSQILPILKEYEKEEEKLKLQQDKGHFLPYKDMSDEQTQTVDYVEEELGVDQHVAVLAVNQLGVDDAIDLGRSSLRAAKVLSKCFLFIKLILPIILSSQYFPVGFVPLRF